MATAQYPEQVAGKEIVGDCVVVFRQWGFLTAFCLAHLEGQVMG